MEIENGAIVYRGVIRKRGSSSYLLLPSKVAEIMELEGGTSVDVRVEKHDDAPPTLSLVKAVQ